MDMTEVPPLPSTIPALYEWKLARRNPRKPAEAEERTYYQTELSIDGEVFLLGIIQKAGEVLVANGVTPAEFAALETESGEVDWQKALVLLTRVAHEAPALMSESCAVILGYYPTREDGTRDPEWDPTVKWLRGAINVTRWITMVQVFLAQNDYQRLAAPFVNALNRGVEIGSRVRAARQERDSATDGMTSGAPTSTSPEPMPSSPATDTALHVTNGAP